MRVPLMTLLSLALSVDMIPADATDLKITLTSVFVDDQEKALEFYTKTLGFQKKTDMPLGEYRWLTVVSAAAPDGTQLLLEPNVNPAAKTYQAELRKQGIPAASFEVSDVRKTIEKLSEKGVTFTMKPTEMGTATIAILDDTCGNLIQVHQAE